MQYIIVDGSGAVVHGPSGWLAFSFGLKLRELLASIPDCPVGSVALSGDAPAGALEWEGCPYRIVPCSISGADYDRDTQNLGDPVVAVAQDGQSASAAYSPADKPLADVKAARLAALATKRWEAECGGVAVGGTLIATDDRSKTLLSGKYRTAEKNPDATHRWKGAGGEIALTSAQVIAIGDAVSAHVQACFDHELDLMAEIGAAETVAAVRAIDIGSGW